MKDFSSVFPSVLRNQFNSPLAGITRQFLPGISISKASNAPLQDLFLAFYICYVDLADTELSKFRKLWT